MPSKSRLLGSLLIITLWLVLAILLLAVFLEYGGGIMLYQRFRYGEPSAEELERRRISEQYRPFAIQHLNPFTLFGFPLDPEDRVRLSNDVVTLGAHGFRGEGPEERRGRELAFLVGGSTAFGHYASGDSTTIAGYLNQKQERYHFVNAGVPSWNTMQELHRIVDELLAYEPALIVALHGANDAAIALRYAQDGLNYPPGTPESFNALAELVDDIRGEIKRRPRSLISRMFPELTRHGRNMWRTFWGLPLSEPVRELSSEELEDVAEKAAAKYRFNVGVMTKVTEAFGGRFLAVLQPDKYLHDSSEELSVHSEMYRLFRDAVLKERGDLPIHDLTMLFNEIPQPIDAQAQEQNIFVDRVHFTDRGNEIVVEQMIKLLQEEGMIRERAQVAQ